MTRFRPQRITPPAPIGSLLKREITVLRPKGPESDKDPDYLAQVRECPCLYCGLDPCGEAAHLRMASGAYGKSSGMGKKPADRWAIPLCGSDHRLAQHAQHQRNESEFWRSIGINPLMVATDLYKQRGDLVAMRSVVFVAIAQRSAATSELRKT